MNVGEAFVRQLGEWGVDTVFGVSGSSLIPILEAFRRQERVRYVTVRNEESAAFMASAHAKLTGRLGVCVAHAGPGAAHLVNGLYDAHKDRYPVLAITGQVPTEKVGTTYKQAADEDTMFTGCTGFSRQVAAPDEALIILTSAMRYAIVAGDSAHVAVPQDLLAAEFAGSEPVPAPTYLEARPALDGGAVDEIARVLQRARRPVILMGMGARRAADAALALAERLGAAVMTSLLAKGALPEQHPLVVGPVGEAGTEAALAAAKAADVILVLGSTWWPATFMPTSAQVVQVDTRPTAIGAGTPVTIGLVARVEDVLPELLRRVDSRPGKGADVKRRRDVAPPEAFPAHPALILSLVRTHLPDDAIIAVDTGLVTLWYGRSFPARKERTLISGRWRTMGYGLPAALAAKAACPDRTVVALVGDGGFAMTGLELLTAIQHDLRVTVLIFNNGLLGEEAAKQEKAGLRVFGMDLKHGDWASLAKACGAVGLRPQDVRELDGYLDNALRAPRTTVLDIPTRYVAPPSLIESPPLVAFQQ